MKPTFCSVLSFAGATGVPVRYGQFELNESWHLERLQNAPEFDVFAGLTVRFGLVANDDGRLATAELQETRSIRIERRDD